ncbi:MAG: hypothetical protein ACI8XO_004858 [Verrucomicrobiales bacterium]|jgi:hypothetical protein
MGSETQSNDPIHKMSSIHANIIKAVTLPLAATGVVLLLIAPSTLRAEDKKLIREAGAHFQQTCSSCHVPPDLRFATDRAWLGQILETD